MNLPRGYRERVLARLPQGEAERYFEALDEPYARGLRRNPKKPAPLPEGALTGIPWEARGVYLSQESAAGAQPLHEAGAYYLQEPSAMIPARLLAPREGDAVLDLCAAPGGKATQLASLMTGGLLVCNEPVPGRAQTLSRNIERMGVDNALVVSESPERLAGLWRGLFDRVLVDAPCSGEGMFRRHPETAAQWQPQSPEGCARRQRAILESALALLKPGGRLCYATCTHSREEDEDMIFALLEAHRELSPVAFSLPIGGGKTLKSENGAIHLWPHQALCEGHFAALLEKRASDEPREALLPAKKALGKPDRALSALYEAFCKQLGSLPYAPNAQFGATLVSAPDLPPLHGVRVLRAGVSLGALKGSVFAPDHALALALPMPVAARHIEIDKEQAALYQAGQTLPCDEGLSGYLILTNQGLPLGFAKASGGQLKNHYPKGLRRTPGQERE